MSNKREREKRREARMAEESKADSSDQRKKILQMGAGAVFLVVVVIAVLIVVASSGSDGGDASNIKDADVVNQELSGIPQQGMVLGDPSAPVEVIEYGDLQCPACKAYAEEMLPQVIEGPVKQGQAKIAFKNFTIIGPESTPAGVAALAAGEQNKGWNFVDIFYKNQGKENGGYVTDDFVTAIAEAAGVADIAKFKKDLDNAKFEREVEKTSAEAQRQGFTGTPSFLIKGPSTNGLELLEFTSPQELEDAIDAAS